MKEKETNPTAEEIYNENNPPTPWTHAEVIKKENELNAETDLRQKNYTAPEPTEGELMSQAVDEGLLTKEDILDDYQQQLQKELPPVFEEELSEDEIEEERIKKEKIKDFPDFQQGYAEPMRIEKVAKKEKT